MIISKNRELLLVLAESRVQGLVRPVYKDDGIRSSGDGVVVQPSPAGGVLPRRKTARPSPAPAGEWMSLREQINHTLKK